MRAPPLSRRRFLQTAAVATAAAQLAPKLHAASASPAQAALPYPEHGTLIPDEGWHLWIDDKAAWKEDDIFLPEDVSWVDDKLCGKGKPLPVNAPTGGWFALTVASSMQVTLPTSVEQHCWGKYGSRPYTPEEYRYAADTKGGTITPVAPADDNVPQNGAYFGVSWWYREIEIPASMKGKRIFLHIRGAHLRAEVYLNQKLVGYSIMEELPFEADLTHAADPGGKNQLAIRITNPFGRFDWVDGLNAKWGKVSLYRSHGFGALDRGMTISAHGTVRIKDAWVLSTPETKKVRASIELEAGSLKEWYGDLSCEVLDPRTNKRLFYAVATPEMRSGHFSINRDVVDPKTGSIADTYEFAQKGSNVPLLVNFDISCPSADLWDLETPTLYNLKVSFSPNKPLEPDTRTIAFGFRSFTVEGIGPEGSNSNALFRLNGRRIRIYSSISWGFWGLNGMFPVPELAEKEVVAAKTLGLNCLNFHRNLAKEDVLRKHDELGLLRYMEPGAGKMAIGKLPAAAQANAAGIVMEKPTSEADLFAQRYMFVKCVEMVKAHRSHPSVIEYCLQNEIGADLKNPATLAILKAMHDEDPSRMVVLNDGFVARGAAQAWYEPWSSDLKEGKLHRSDEEKWGDFWNNHQGAGDQWYDEFYKSPTDYTYRAPSRNILTEFGEMEGCAHPDNHPLMLHQITETYKQYGGTSYDLADHEEIIAGYERFLDKWNFRKAFPTSESVFLAVSRTCYESWMNYMENARISDELDFAVISGWESTVIENHSGIVDNLRNFKSDPKLIAGSLLPVRPIAKQHAMCVGSDESFVFDLYLANDTGKPVTGELIFSVIDPKNNITEIGRYKVPNQSPDVFSYLVAENVTYKHRLNKTVPYFYEGAYTFKFALSSQPLVTHTRQLWMTATKLKETVGLKAAVSGITPTTRKQLEKFLEVSDFKTGEKYDLIISGGLTSHTSADQNVGETTGESMPVMKPGHTPEPGEVPTPTELGHLQHGILEAVQAGTPLFAIPQADTLSEGVAQQLAAAGAFTYHGAVGDFRAPWMGNWYFGREHALFEGLPTNAALGSFYQIKGRQSNGLLVNGKDVEVVVGYSRDHDRNVGAGTFTTRLGKTKILFHRTPDFHPVLQQRFLANAIRWLTS